jgi:uncharacterized protein (TIGR02996 family)
VNRESAVPLHPDANALIQAILRNPTDASTRLLFADWLEESCVPANVAWARFIRLNIQIANCPADVSRENLIVDRNRCKSQIEERITIPAAVFVSCPRAFCHFIPAERITVLLTGYTPERDVLTLVGTDAVLQHRFLPLAIRETVLLTAFDNPQNLGAVKDLESKFGCRLLGVLAQSQELVEAVATHYRVRFRLPVATPSDVLPKRTQPQPGGQRPAERSPAATIKKTQRPNGKLIASHSQRIHGRELHPDAEVWVRAILDNPSDVARRLAFADWLEKTGEQSNVAWAWFIRLREEANHYPPKSPDRTNWIRKASEFAEFIQTTLLIPTTWLSERYTILLQLLPRTHIKPVLGGCELSKALIRRLWDMDARKYCVFPVARSKRAFWVAMTDPNDTEKIESLQDIFRKDVVPVQASAEEILAAINFFY